MPSSPPPGAGPPRPQHYAIEIPGLPIISDLLVTVVAPPPGPDAPDEILPTPAGAEEPHEAEDFVYVEAYVGDRVVVRRVDGETRTVSEDEALAGLHLTACKARHQYRTLVHPRRRLSPGPTMPYTTVRDGVRGEEFLMSDGSTEFLSVDEAKRRMAKALDATIFWDDPAGVVPCTSQQYILNGWVFVSLHNNLTVARKIATVVRRLHDRQMDKATILVRYEAAFL